MSEEINFYYSIFAFILIGYYFTMIDYYPLHHNAFLNFIIELIKSSSSQSILNGFKFNIVLSGGETPKMVYKKLSNIDTNWSYWNFWLSDERCLEKGSEFTNQSTIIEYLINNIPVKAEQVNFMEGFLGPTEAALRYHDRLKNIPIFDITLLGIGEDGHTASLFPGHSWGESDELDAVPIADSPKFPADRVSLSLRRLNRSKIIAYIVAGDAKRQIVTSIINGEQSESPVNFIRGLERTYLIYCNE